MISFVVFLVGFGLVVGAVGRLVIPGPDPMTLPQTLAIGLGASAVSGVLTRVLFGPHTAPALGVTLVISTLIVAGVRVYRSRQATAGARPPAP